MKKFVDLVCSGCDFSGTSTQIKGLARFLYHFNLTAKDLRGSNFDILFHSQYFDKFNQGIFSLKSFENDPTINYWDKSDVLRKIWSDLANLQVASMEKNDVTSYIDPNSADAWIMEEPPKRGAGLVNRVIEQNRSKFKSELNPVAAALSHQSYRTDEFLRFRNPLRVANKIILRSRSEESACYQIADPEILPQGIDEKSYLSLPGHQIAFQNAPTHLFIVHGPENWEAKNYLKLKSERQEGRIIDDHEANVKYQLLVNKRYATDWLEELYEKGCSMHGGIPPKIIRFDIYCSKENLQLKMNKEFKKILEENGQIKNL